MSYPGIDKKLREAKKKYNRTGLIGMTEGEFKKLKKQLAMIFARDYKVLDVNSSDVISINETIESLIGYISECEKRYEVNRQRYLLGVGVLGEYKRLDDLLDGLDPEEDKK